MTLLSQIVLSLFFISTMGGSFTSAEPVKYDIETDIQLGDATFRISAGWSFDRSKSLLVSPEGDLKAFLIEKDLPENGNVTLLSEQTWSTVYPHFNLKIAHAITLPPKSGWEQIHQIVYDTPAKENRAVLTLARIFKGTAYMVLVDATHAGLSKRASQLQIIDDTWRPLDMVKEDLSKNPVKSFGKDEARELDSFVARAMKDLAIPGAAISVIQNGSVIYQKGFGVKKLGDREKVTTKTLFMIGSTTKPLTTLMLAKLVEQKRLKWTTPIEKVLPSFALSNPEVTSRFEVQHTACACTGMPRRDFDFVFSSLDHSAEDTVQQMREFSPTTGFGETFQYSNHLVAIGGFLGGNVYSKGSDEKDLFSKYESAMRDLVFSPLQMTATRVRPRAKDFANMASPHSRALNGQMTAFPQVIDDMVYAVAPSGSVWSNVEDMSKYVMMELEEGKGEDGAQLYDKKQLLMRRKPGVKIDENTSYGLGLILEKSSGVSVIGHGGNTIGFTHDMYFMPEKGLGVVIQANAGSVNGFRSAVRQKILELLFAATPKSDDTVKFARDLYQDSAVKLQERISTKDTKWISNLIGVYESRELGRLVVSKNAREFQISSPRFKSALGTYKDSSSEKLLALISPPWSGSIQFRVQKVGTGGNQKDQASVQRWKLILDDAQMKYEFFPVSE